MHSTTKGTTQFTRREFVQGVGSLAVVLANTQPVAGASGDPHEELAFRAARPVWPRGREEEMNLFVGFRGTFSRPEVNRVILRVTASTIYRCFVNGKFCGYGPARAGRGYFRVDEWDLTDYLRADTNVVAIEVAGYNVNSYYLLDQPSFLQAEVIAGDQVLVATGAPTNPFQASIIGERLQRVQRYSFQRPFSEVYRLETGCNRWRADASVRLRAAECEPLPAKRLLRRYVPNPQFFLRQPIWITMQGKVETGFKPAKIWKDRSLTDIGPKLKGFKESQLEVIPSIELQTVRTLPAVQNARLYTEAQRAAIPAKSYLIADFGTDLTGFLGATITCRQRTRLFFTFDEILSEGDVDFKRLSCVNIILYELPAGAYQVESFEPYTLRYLKLIALEGDCEVEGIYLREYDNPAVEQAHFAASDEKLNRLFAAGRETYRQNAVDLFTDCPSRERAGWLCDSYFTSRVAALLSGNTVMERNFLENFLLPESFPYLPKGMLPMCYPADHNDGNFIPNWALWFVLQLEEYGKRSGDRELVEALRPKVLALFEYFRPFRNEDGLLEKLKGWVFVEWSAANNFVQDVNYPSNMLFAAALDAAARLYSLSELHEDAEKVREVIRRQSFDGEFFVDNALRRDGKLQVTRNRSEVCQYFAFYFGVATPSRYPELWRILREKFGPNRRETKAFPEVHEANAFVGNMLRLEILSNQGLGQQILDESVSYLLYMANRTGTLWENVTASASCNHGFASHIVKTLYRDVLGLYEVDSVNRVVHLRFPEVRLEWCEGRMPVDGGNLVFSWRREGGKHLYRVEAPAGYRIVLVREETTWAREA